MSFLLNNWRTTPGAWNIIVRILVLAAIGAVVLWLVTTLFLKTNQPDANAEDRRGAGA